MEELPNSSYGFPPFLPSVYLQHRIRASLSSVGHITPLLKIHLSGSFSLGERSKQPSGLAQSAALATLRPDSSLRSPSSLCTNPTDPVFPPQGLCANWTLCLMTTAPSLTSPTAGLRLLSEVSLTPSPSTLPLFPIYLYPLALTPSNLWHHWLIILFNVSFPHWDVNAMRAGGFVWWFTAVSLMPTQWLMQDRRFSNNTGGCSKEPFIYEEHI